MLIPSLLVAWVVHPSATPLPQHKLDSIRPSAGFFVENQGQWDEAAILALRGENEDLILGPHGWSWVLRRAGESPIATANNHPAGKAIAWLDEEELQMAPTINWARIDLRLLGAQPVEPQLVSASNTQLDYYLDGEVRTSVPTGTETLARDVWPGIDLRFRTEPDRVKHQFELQAGIDPSIVQIEIHGADPRIAYDGSLVMTTARGEIRDAAPIAWQLRDGNRLPVEVRYALTAGSKCWKLSFVVEHWDPNLPLILDPDTLVNCGYIGGSDYDELRGIDVTDAGKIWVVGHTSSTDLPARGAFQGSNAGGDYDCFVAGVDSDGVLRNLTYLGGSDRELAYDLSVDAAGNVYVGGGTNSSDFPTAVGPYLTQSGSLDGFVTKIDPNGNLVYSGFIGGSQFDSIRGNAVDAEGNHYVIGRTVDTGNPNDPPYTFPTEVGPDLTHNGLSDAFVAKINDTGDDVLYCGFIGGSDIDYGRDVEIDAQGYAYYVGWTNSDETTFPVVGGPDLTYNGGEELWGGNFAQYGDGFLSRITPDGSNFASNGYVGGTGSDAIFSVRIDGFGGVYIAGHTTSTEASLPVTYGPDITFNGAPSNEPYGDALVGKLKPSLTDWEYLGFVGGDSQDRAWRMDIDDFGRMYIVGNTRSDQLSFPHQGHGARLHEGGDEDGYVAMISANGSRVLYGSYFAGEGREVVRDVAVDSDGYVHVAGWSNSTSFPLVSGPDVVKPGGVDGFVSRVLPFDLLIRAGNAIDPTTRERTEMLYVNGQIGDGAERRLFVPYGGGSVTIDVDAIGFDGKPLAESDFVLYVWQGEPGAREASHLVAPSGLSVGTGAFPTPLATGTSSVEGLWTLINTTGRPKLLGKPISPRKKPAPLTMNVDLPGPGTYTLQALIEEPNKPSRITLSNVIVLIVA
ncbi:MAG: SBBP repeat-containing protein [Planctomycetes bacterium]|nr:SBBP repeat-containing protein [Planctomycetota bacterium]